MSVRPRRRPLRWAIGLLVLGLLARLLVFRASPVPGLRTVVFAQPIEGSVLVDAVPSGPPGAPIQVAAGTHRIGLQARGWTAATRTVALRPGAALRILLQARPTPVTLGISTDPPASLSIDGRPAGTTPTTLSLLPGPHRLRFGTDGYLPMIRTLLLRPGEPQDLAFALHKAPPRQIPLFAAVGQWSRPVTLSSHTRFGLAFKGRLRLRLGNQVFLVEPDQASDLGEIGPGPLQVKSAQSTPFPVSLSVEEQ